MNDEEAARLRERIGNLERRQRTIVAFWFAIGLLVLLSGLDQEVYSQPSTLRARSLDIVDAKGVVGIKLRISDIAGPIVEINGAGGTPRVVLSGSASTVWINDKSGKMPLASLGVDLDGGWLRVSDSKGRVVFKAP